jgi:mRNA interferase HigB
MHIISRSTLMAATEQKKYREARDDLDVWYRIAKREQWTSLMDVRQHYPSADGVTVGKKTYTVFNIRHNEFRLIVWIVYDYKKIFIKFVMTHAEYDRNEWKKILKREQEE